MIVADILIWQPSSGPRRPRRVRLHSLLFVAALLASAASLPLRASAIPYSLAAFQMSNSNADGAAVAVNAGLTLMLTGGNNGSGLAGTTDFLVTAALPALIEFQYAYNSLDSPGFDSAGYLLQGQFTQLTDTSGDSGTASFSVAAGDIFGFRVATFDNTQEPGVLMISGFAAGAASVPEPAPLPALAAIIAFAACVRRKLRHREELK